MLVCLCFIYSSSSSSSVSSPNHHFNYSANVIHVLSVFLITQLMLYRWDLCVSMPVHFDLHLSECGRGIFKVCNDVSERCVHKAEIGTDESGQVLTWNGRSPSFCHSHESNPGQGS